MLRTVPLLLLLLTLMGQAAEVPLGHKDFYPSAERPVGFRGDGNGWFPSATPVTEWWEGTPLEREQVSEDGRKKTRQFEFADTKPKNIVWKTEMPSWANTQPIVIGDKVVCYGEPDLVICVDAHTGKLLWTRHINAWLAAGVAPDKAARAHELFSISEALYRVIELQYHFNTCGRYLPEEKLKPLLELFLAKEWPAIQMALKQNDPEGNYEDACQKFEELIKAGIATHVDAKGSWDYGKKCNIIQVAIARRIQAITGRKLPTEMPWGNMVGWNMSVPVSDGQFIYVQMGQGQTACLDLAGNIVWQTFFEQKNVSTHHVLSPVLASGILVDMHGNSVLRGLDAKTGKVVWEAPTAITTKSAKSGYYIASHKIVRLAGTDYLVTSQCNIIRIKDGKVVGEVPYHEAYHGGAPIAGTGDVIVKCASGDGWEQPFRAYKLVRETNDKVTATLLWESKARGGYESRVVTPSATFLCGRPVSIVDTLSGTARAELRDGAGGVFRLLAGNLLISAPEGSRHWSARRPDGTVLLPFTTVDVSDPSKPTVLSRQNLLGGRNQPRSPAIEKYLPNLWQHPEFFNAKGGRPAHFAHVDTCIFPAGNRLFLRSVGHLYCIGDPHVPYNGAKTM